MFEIIKVYRETLPDVRLIGKRYTNADRVDGSYGAKWAESDANGLWQKLDELPKLEGIDSGCLGIMNVQGDFEYWIGRFFAAGTGVPEGLNYADIPAGDLGTCWIKGNGANGEIYGETPHNACYAKIKEQGWEAAYHDLWFFERYNPERFMTPDADGNVVLDYCFYLMR